MKTNPKLCINPTGTIVGFNYAFTKALLQKLKKLNADRKVSKNKRKKHDDSGEVTDIVSSIVGYLSGQTGFPHPVIHPSGEWDSGPRMVSFKALNDLIAHAEEFLAIFETKE